jgi:predicted O-methyltransferase YrrM
MKIFNRELIRFFPREAVKFAKQYFKGNKINACEVGVYFGEHARSMNNELNIENLYLIDPYTEYGDEKTQEHLNKAKETAHRTNRKGNEVWIENISYGATLNLLPLNFLYIDANHEYDAVKRDLQIYYPFVKKGGIIAGHDIQGEGVSKAVLEFANKNKLTIQFGDRRDWWIIKGYSR